VSTPFTGWLLDEDERAALLVRFPPRHGEAIAHHVTLSVRDETTPTPVATTGEIVGQADDGGVQAMVVSIAGTADRPGGGTYHITWSLAEGRSPRESNDVIAAGWTAFEAPVPIALTPKPYG
jgi:hypothetical protein